jgi:hypothetical protein
MAMAIKGLSTFGTVTEGLKALWGMAGSTLGAPGAGQMGISPEYQQLLETQIKLNQEMTTISMHTNIEKARHDAKMAIVRNVRVQ